MSPVQASALSRRDRLWPAVSASVAAHVVVLVWAVTRPAPPPIDLQQKAIVAKLVRLGEKRPEAYLPRKPAAPPAPAPAPAPPAPVAAPPAAPKVAAPAPAAKAPPSPPAQSQAPAPGKPGTSLSSILSKVQKQADHERWGDPDGDASGDSDDGSVGDRYLALVQRAIKDAYVLPATISERDRMHLKATVVLLVEPNGRLADWRFETRSGNSAYDAALERAIHRARLPPPPPELRDQYRRNGFGINFHL